MQCPNCVDKKLKTSLTKQGVEVDYCPSCKGVWLDKGEIYHFTKDPEKIAKKLSNAARRESDNFKLSPRTGMKMEEIAYAEGLYLDYCPASGGLWFDNLELKKVIESNDISFKLDQNTLTDENEAQEKAKDKILQTTGLAPLPNLFVRSVFTIVSLYTVLIVFFIGVSEYNSWNPAILLSIGLTVVTLQFIIGPFLIDSTLTWMYKIQWIDPDKLPNHLNIFIEKICKEKKIPFPKIGIIDDGGPQAFTYGQTPKNARIVITKGIFELLEEDEVEAVVAHEFGHVMHWDMFFMTVVNFVPLVFYYVYRVSLQSASKSRGDKNNGGAGLIVLLSLIIYIVTEYGVLWFSRTREFFADRFAGEITGKPSSLASALVKIAYGLSGKEQKTEEVYAEVEENKKEPEKEELKSLNLDAIGALGIFDSNMSRAFAITSHGETSKSSEINKDHIREAMRWDIWNPWAKWYELSSTHPLTANRLLAISRHSIDKTGEPYISFNEKKPESYWDEFFQDFIIYFLPYFFGFSGLFFAFFRKINFMNPDLKAGLVIGSFILFGITMFIRIMFSHPQRFFPNMNVAALVKKVKVSIVRPVPCTLTGRIIGRGVAGYIFSEDFVMKDDTGIIFLDLKHPFVLKEKYFALFKRQEYDGKEVTVEGWYRRAPVPSIEIHTITCEGNTIKGKTASYFQVFAFSSIVLGLLLLLYFYLVG